MFYYGFGYFSYFPLYLLAILVVAIASSSVRFSSILSSLLFFHSLQFDLFKVLLGLQVPQV